MPRTLIKSRKRLNKKAPKSKKIGARKSRKKIRGGEAQTDPYLEELHRYAVEVERENRRREREARINELLAERRDLMEDFVLISEDLRNIQAQMDNITQEINVNTEIINNYGKGRRTGIISDITDEDFYSTVEINNKLKKTLKSLDQKFNGFYTDYSAIQMRGRHIDEILRSI